jgi:16S rRNA (cytidine1402-2'-O)-methyltransferase
LRAVKVLNEVDIIACESFKEARRLLNHFQIDKELILLNEHNEREAVVEIIDRMMKGQNAALISDCGTPVFSDPGYQLLQSALERKVKVIPLPGANSLIPALIGSGFPLNSFYYAGWLSPKTEIRKKELSHLKRVKEIIVLYDTPYRLTRIVKDLMSSFAPETPAVIAFEISTEKERFIRGEISVLDTLVSKQKLKGEFVLLLDNRH